MEKKQFDIGKTFYYKTLAALITAHKYANFKGTYQIEFYENEEDIAFCSHLSLLGLCRFLS